MKNSNFNMIVKEKVREMLEVLTNVKNLENVGDFIMVLKILQLNEEITKDTSKDKPFPNGNSMNYNSIIQNFLFNYYNACGNNLVNFHERVFILYLLSKIFLVISNIGDIISSNKYDLVTFIEDTHSKMKTLKEQMTKLNQQNNDPINKSNFDKLKLNRLLIIYDRLLGNFQLNSQRDLRFLNMKYELRII